jgi:hemolysin activation/secretion protein
VTAFVLRQVVIENSSLPAPDLEAAWRPFVGQSLDTKGLLKVTDALAAVYERRDVAIYTVTIPEQTFTDGVLHVRALEGHVESANIKGPAGGRNRDLVEAYVAQLKAERPLRRSTLERYVSLIRDIPGLNSGMELVNGDGPDGVRLNLELKPRPVLFGMSVNNRGTAYLGRTQVQGDVYLNSLFRQGDMTRLTLAAPTDFEKFQSYAIQHIEPIGSDGLTLSANLSYLRTRPKAAPILGHSTAAGVQMSYPLIRSYNRDSYATVSVDGVDSDNAFLGFTFANDRIRAARGALSYSVHDDRRLAFISGTFSQGIDGLGASTDPEIAKLGFRKLNIRGGSSLAVGKSAALRVNFAGQASGNRLPGTEQFALGGDEYGRGYEASVIAGDYGYAGAFEAAYRPQKLPKGLGGSEAYGFVDGGKVWYRGRFGNETSHARLASGGFGVRAQIKDRIIVQLEAAKPFDNPQPSLDNRPWRGIFSIRTLW